MKEENLKEFISRGGKVTRLETQVSETIVVFSARPKKKLEGYSSVIDWDDMKNLYYDRKGLVARRLENKQKNIKEL